jgi:hypothetical protein
MLHPKCTIDSVLTFWIRGEAMYQDGNPKKDDNMDKLLLLLLGRRRGSKPTDIACFCGSGCIFVPARIEAFSIHIRYTTRRYNVKSTPSKSYSVPCNE